MNDARKPEGIREWYRRTTYKAIRAIIIATITAALVAVVGFFAVPRDMTLHLQVFNGAWTIPAFGGIWLAAFILIWLIPMREVSFRGQESMENLDARFKRIEERAMKFFDEGERIFRAIQADIHEMAESARDVKLDELTVKFERKMDEVKETIRAMAEPDPPEFSRLGGGKKS